MLLLALTSAFAQEPITSDPPWEADAWRSVYEHHARQARYGLVMATIAPPAVVLGVGVAYAGALTSQWPLAMSGVAMSLGGLAGTAVGVPYLWVHTHRSWQALGGLDRAPAFVWAPLGLTAGLAQLGLASFGVTEPDPVVLVAGTYGAVLAGCVLQLAVDDAAARRAGPRVAVVPAPDGVRIAGRW